MVVADAKVVEFNRVKFPARLIVVKGEPAPSKSVTPSTVKFPAMVYVPEENVFVPPVIFKFWYVVGVDGRA